MKLIAFLLIVSSLTKLYVANDFGSINLDKLLNGISLDELKLKQIAASILIIDGLIGIISGVFILCV